MSPARRSLTRSDPRGEHEQASAGTLRVILGDQLDLEGPALAGIDRAHDMVLMMEVRGESTHVHSHVQRTVLFLSAMRHFAGELAASGTRVCYISIDEPTNSHSIDGEVRRAVRELAPQRIVMTEPGEHRLRGVARDWERSLGIPVEIKPDSHFLTSREEFERWARGKRDLVMEFFYREQRRRLKLLLDDDGKPQGGAWNLDKENRLSFGKGGPDPRPTPPRRFEPDAITRDVMALVRREMPDLPGRLDHFRWPVTRAEALEALADFIEHRLPLFGPYEDAMWTDEPFVYHSLLSPLLNLKLLRPRECVEAAIEALEAGRAPLQSVEGFVRQIIGWREYIRGVYDLEGAGYAERNSLGHQSRLPSFYWTGRTDMNCMRRCINQVLDHGYGHHIQRLMVTGNFALLAGVHPKEVSDWYLGMYVDGVDWATLPNTLGMSQHADARPGSPPGVTGLVGTKPYAASGKYIQKMSNYCAGCRYDVNQRTGESACPFNTLYWDFLIRHERIFERNQRMKLMLKHVETMPREERVRITVSAGRLRERLGMEGDGGAVPLPDAEAAPTRSVTLFGEDVTNPRPGPTPKQSRQRRETRSPKSEL